MKKLLIVMTISLFCSCAMTGTVSKVNCDLPNSLKANVIVKSEDKTYTLINTNHYVKDSKVREGQKIKFRNNKVVKIVGK